MRCPDEIVLTIPSGSEPCIPIPLRVRLISSDVALWRALRAGLDIETAVDVVGHAALRAEAVWAEAEADIVLLDAGPPAPQDEELARLRASESSAPVIVVAHEIDGHTRDLGASVDAVGYLKKSDGLADIAPLVLELAVVGRVKR